MNSNRWIDFIQGFSSHSGGLELCSLGFSLEKEREDVTCVWSSGTAGKSLQQTLLLDSLQFHLHIPVWQYRWLNRLHRGNRPKTWSQSENVNNRWLLNWTDWTKLGIPALSLFFSVRTPPLLQFDCLDCGIKPVWTYFDWMSFQHHTQMTQTDGETAAWALRRYTQI